MANCPHCGAAVPEGTVYCGNCGAAKDSTSSASISQFRVTGQESTALPSPSSSGDLQLRLKKVMRRAELLTYAAVGLGVALLAVIIGISLL
jgi:uncharacterized membrane protein YvbJ